MATLIPPYAAPKTSRTRPSAVADRVSGGSATLSARRAPQATVTRWLPNRWHRRPVTTIVATAPADTPSSASPNAPGEAPTWALMAGMRTTQPAKVKPSTAKKAVRAIRAAVQEGASAPRPSGEPWRPALRRAVRILFNVGTK